MASKPLAELSVVIGASLKPFNAAMARIKNTLQILKDQKISIGSAQGMTIAGAGAMGASFAATTAAVKGLTDALGKLAMVMPNAAFAANDLAMKVHRIKVGFQEATPEVLKAIDELAYKVGYSKTELATMAADLGPMLHGLGATEAQAAGLTKELLKLGTGASFVHEIELPQFMKLLESGIEGSTKALQRLNVFMTPFQVEMEAYRMAGRGQIAMTEEQQMQWARLSLIMKQLKAQAIQNDWAHKQLGGTFRETKGRINDLVLSLGEIVKPIFSRAFMRINEILQNMGRWLGANKKAMQDWASGVVDGILTALSSWEEFKKALGKAWDWVWGGIKGAFVSAWNWITDYVVASIKYIGEVLSTTITNALKLTDKEIPGGERIAAIVEERRKARDALANVGGQAKGLLAQVFGGGGNPAAPGGDKWSAMTFKQLELSLAKATEMQGNVFGPKWNKANDVQAIKDELKKRRSNRGRRGGNDEEPTPELPAFRPGMGRLGQAEFVGIADFAKKIQLAALGDQDEQLTMLTRIAHWTEMMAQNQQRWQGRAQAVAVAAGP